MIVKSPPLWLFLLHLQPAASISWAILQMITWPYWFCFHLSIDVTGHDQRNLRRFFTKCESSNSHISLRFASPPHLHRNASALFLLLPSIREARVDTRIMHEGSLLALHFTIPNWQFYFDTAYNSLVAWKGWIIAQGESPGEMRGGRNFGDWIKL